MGFTRLVVIGLIALTTIMQAGWGQGVDNDRAQLIEQIRQLSRSNSALQKLVKASGVELPQEFVETLPSLDVRFAGGTLGDLVAELKSLRPYSNILLGEGAGAVKVPAFEVFGVTPAGAIWVAQSVAGPDWKVQIDTVNPGDGSAATTIVRLSEDHKANATPSLSAPSKAWNLRTWMSNDGGHIEGAFAAIQVGLESFGGSPIELKYHEPTGVLMARGNQEQINFIESIIKAAAESLLVRVPIEVQTAPITIANSSRRIAEIEGEITVLAAQVGVYDARISRLIESKVGEETIATQRVELAHVQARMENLRHEKQTLRNAIEHAERTLADYELKSRR